MSTTQTIRRLARQGLLIIITAALVLEATALIQIYFTQKGLREEATRRAESELESTGLEIADVMDQAEAAVRTALWTVQQLLSEPDSLSLLPGVLVEANPVIYGSTIALRPDYYPDREPLFSPYAHRTSEGIVTKMLGTDLYDYTEMEWYLKAAPEGYWSEPYFDTGGGEKLMTTYSVPVLDGSGEKVGVLTADLALDWLTDLVGNVNVYPRAFSMLFSQTGQIMVCPEEILDRHRSLSDVAASLEDTAALRIGRSILAGERGFQQIHYGTSVNDVFFAPVERAGWSMAIIIPHDEIFRGVKRVGTLVGILQLLGLAMLVLILFRTIAGHRKLQEVEERKERIENELHIANAIQMSMLPKIYPPFPERDDLDLFGCVEPAKEVGGDLYDFYIRDGRLFFCIGDVSGKGVPASLVMAMTRSMFRTVSAHENGPERIVSAMNESMADMDDSSMFVTFFVGSLDLSTGLLRYCNAGHNAPVTITAEGVTKPLPVESNIPLGIEGQMRFVAQEHKLRPGETLFLYTDGLTEAENDGKELFGEPRLFQALAGCAGFSAMEMVEKVGNAVRQHVGAADQSDDLTLFAIRYKGSPALPPAERRIRLHNDIRQIPQLAGFMETLVSEASIDQQLALQLNLALEEAVTNVIMYAYPSGTDGIVDIEAVLREGEIDFTVSDSGRPFDPTAVRDVDTSLSAEERPIGGLGIHLVRKIMDEVSYARVDERNVLTLRKKI